MVSIVISRQVFSYLEERCGSWIMDKFITQIRQTYYGDEVLQIQREDCRRVIPHDTPVSRSRWDPFPCRFTCHPDCRSAANTTRAFFDGHLLMLKVRRLVLSQEHQRRALHDQPKYEGQGLSPERKTHWGMAHRIFQKFILFFSTMTVTKTQRYCNHESGKSGCDGIEIFSAGV